MRCRDRCATDAKVESADGIRVEVRAPALLPGGRGAAPGRRGAARSRRWLTADRPRSSCWRGCRRCCWRPDRIPAARHRLRADAGRRRRRGRGARAGRRHGPRGGGPRGPARLGPHQGRVACRRRPRRGAAAAAVAAAVAGRAARGLVGGLGAGTAPTVSGRPAALLVSGHDARGSLALAAALAVEAARGPRTRVAAGRADRAAGRRPTTLLASPASRELEVRAASAAASRPRPAGTSATCPFSRTRPRLDELGRGAAAAGAELVVVQAGPGAVAGRRWSRRPRARAAGCCWSSCRASARWPRSRSPSCGSRGCRAKVVTRPPPALAARRALAGVRPGRRPLAPDRPGRPGAAGRRRTGASRRARRGRGADRGRPGAGGDRRRGHGRGPGTARGRPGGAVGRAQHARRPAAAAGAAEAARRLAEPQPPSPGALPGGAHATPRPTPPGATASTPSGCMLSFPDAEAMPPLRARARVAAAIDPRELPGGERLEDPRRLRQIRVVATAVAEASLPGGDWTGMPGQASGGGYSGPLAYRNGEGMRPDVARAYDRWPPRPGARGCASSSTQASARTPSRRGCSRAHPDPTWVAPPGRSLHRCATELDLGPPSAYGWLAANARRFGFLQRYSWEPWHYGFTAGPAPCSAAGESGGLGSTGDGPDGEGGSLPGCPRSSPPRYREPIMRSAGALERLGGAAGGAADGRVGLRPRRGLAGRRRRASRSSCPAPRPPTACGIRSTRRPRSTRRRT